MRSCETPFGAGWAAPGPTRRCRVCVSPPPATVPPPALCPQAQFSHLGSSLHSRTPFPYQTPEDVWWSFILTNVLYTLGPQLLAYRCLRCPAFFLPPTPASLHRGKKHQ